MMNKEKMIKKIQKLSKAQLERLIKELFLFFLSFLNSLSTEEDERLKGKMEELILAIEKQFPQGRFPNGFDERKKQEVVNFFLFRYRELFLESLSPENRERFEKNLFSLLEKVSTSP